MRGVFTFEIHQTNSCTGSFITYYHGLHREKDEQSSKAADSGKTDRSAEYRV